MRLLSLSSSRYKEEEHRKEEKQVSRKEEEKQRAATCWRSLVMERSSGSSASFHYHCSSSSSPTPYTHLLHLPFTKIALPRATTSPYVPLLSREDAWPFGRRRSIRGNERGPGNLQGLDIALNRFPLLRLTACKRISFARLMSSGGVSTPFFGPLPFFDVGETLERMTPFQRRICFTLSLAFLATVAWLRNLSATGLVDDTEPLFAEAARQMIITGDYITPQFNAQPRFDKPALLYWLMALAGKIFGLQVWALRLPSALCAIGLLTGLFLTVQKFGLHLPVESEDQQSVSGQPLLSSSRYLFAIVTAAAFSLNLEVVAWGSTALSDMLLTSMLGATLLSFFWGYAHQCSKIRQKSYLASAFFMGLACLSKGPVGILLPVCVCTSFLLCTGELSKFLRKEVPYVEGVGILLATTLPWYGAMIYKHGFTYMSTFFGYHNIERFLRGVNHHGGRPWWYGAMVILIIFFAVSSSQLPSYYLPVSPAIAMLAACHLSQSTMKKSSAFVASIAPALIYPMLGLGCLLSPTILQGCGDNVAAEIGSLIREQHAHQVAFVVMLVAGAMASCTSEFASLFNSKFRMDSLLCFKGGILTQKSSDNILLPVWILHATCMVVFFMTFVGPVYRATDSIRQAPLRQLAVMASQLQEPGEPLTMVGSRMPSVVFYSRLPTAFFDTEKDAAYALQKEVSPCVKTVLIISDQKCDSLAEPKVLAEAGSYKLVRVRAN